MLNNINLVGYGYVNVYNVFDNEGIFNVQFIEYKKALKFYERMKNEFPDSTIYLTQLEQKVIKQS